LSYIGNTPADKYQTLEKQSFTTSATTGYTLSYSVSSPQDIALFINNVRQNPNSSYTVSGTTLTLTSATTGTDVMYAVFLGKSVGTIGVPVDGVGTSQLVDGNVTLAKLSATGTKDATTFLRGDNTFAETGGNIVNIGTTTVTGTPSEIDIDFDTSTYNQFRIFYEGIQATSDFNMYARAKVGGSIITASNYNSSTLKKHSGGLDSGVYGGQNQAYWYLTHNIGGATNENWSADMLINIGSETGIPMITMTAVYQDNSGNYASVFGGLCYQSFSIINGLRIYPSTGTFDAGKYTVWGIK